MNNVFLRAACLLNMMMIPCDNDTRLIARLKTETCPLLITKPTITNPQIERAA